MISGVALLQTVLASELARAWLAVTVMSALVAVTVRLSVRWVSLVALVIPAAIGVVAVPVSGNAGQGPNRDYATSTAIVFAVAFSLM